MSLLYAQLDSPLGELLLAGDGCALTRLHMQAGRAKLAVAPEWTYAPEAFARVRAQLEEYFAGERRSFADIPLAMRGSEFQRRVWSALREIPYGETISYGELARRVGQPGQARAVGTANARNPIAVIVPCHRVIGADGSLTGFGGGLANKRLLLDLESGQLAARFDVG
jgi:methylated-DNA-[protein]-cysteine S-methyltransferase